MPLPRNRIYKEEPFDVRTEKHNNLKMKTYWIDPEAKEVNKEKSELEDRSEYPV